MEFCIKIDTLKLQFTEQIHFPVLFRVLQCGNVTLEVGTSELSLSQNIQIGHVFRAQYPIIDYFIIEILLKSPLEGEILIGTCKLLINEIEINKIQELSLKSVDSRFKSIELVLEVSIESAIESFTPSIFKGDKILDISNFFCVSFYSKKDHVVSVLHISPNSQTAEISSMKSNFSNLMEFYSNKIENLNRTTVLVYAKEILELWKSFYFLIETSDSEYFIVISNSTNPNALNILCANSSPVALPLSIIIESHERILINCPRMQWGRDKIPSVIESHQTIIKELGLDVKYVPKRLNPYGVVDLFGPKFKAIARTENLNGLKVFLRHAQDIVIDLSITSLDVNGDLKSTYFFNMDNKLKKEAIFGTKNSSFYCSYLILFLKSLSKSVKYLVLCLTSFKGIPLSKYKNLSLMISTMEEVELMKIPLSFKGPEPGNAFAYFERDDDNKWTFEILNCPVQCTTPVAAAKTIVPKIVHIEDDVIWQTGTGLFMSIS